MQNSKAQHPLLTKILIFNWDILVGGASTSYQYASIGDCALVYHSICDLFKSSVFILNQVPNNNF